MDAQLDVLSLRWFFVQGLLRLLFCLSDGHGKRQCDGHALRYTHVFRGERVAALWNRLCDGYRLLLARKKSLCFFCFREQVCLCLIRLRIRISTVIGIWIGVGISLAQSV